MIERIYKQPFNDTQIKLEFEFSIVDDVQNTIDDLNRILHTREPKRLTYDTMPDRYIMARLDGEIETEVFKNTERGVLTFISETNYWLQDYGDGEAPVFRPDAEGVITVDNHGSAPAYPEFSFKFPSDNGYLAIVAPNGYIELGSPEEQDDLELPTSHRVVNEEMHAEDMSDWTKLTSNTHDKGEWVGDYNKLNIGTGQPAFDTYGTKLTKSTNPKAGYYWNTFGYVHDFTENPDLNPAEFNNWKMESRLRFEDSSGTTKNTGMYLIIVMDDMNKPIMTTSIYNVDSNTNTVTVSAKINDFKGNQLTSRIVHEAKFPRGFHGMIKMVKERDTFSWFWDSQREQTVAGATVQVAEKFQVGNVAYIKNSAKYGWHHNGTRYNIQGFTRGRRNTVTDIRTFQGRKQYLISFGGYAIYWINEGDLTKNASGVGETIRQQVASGNRTSQFRIVDEKLAGLIAKKVVVIGGTWDSSNPFTQTNLSSVIIDRINKDVDFKDITNSFNAGDILTINNATSEILVNGSTYQGYTDPASRFFNIDYGESDIQILKSDWAMMPDIQLQLQERWR